MQMQNTAIPDTAIPEASIQTRSPGRGFYRFAAIWFSQMMSSMGGALTSFGLNVWAYQTTKSVTSVALLAMCAMIPRASLSMFGGAIVDRYGPRRPMVAANLGALVSLTPALVPFWQGRLKFWHVCVSVTLVSAWQSLIWPAVSTAVPLLLSKQDYIRGNGMLQMGNAALSIVAPLIGGLVALHYDVGVVLMITAAAHTLSILALALTRIPRPQAPAERARANSLSKEIADAWTFLRQEPTLLRMVIIFSVFTFFIAIPAVLLKPLILSFASASNLGVVMSVGGLGMLLGGLAVTAFGKGASSFKQIAVLMTVDGICTALAGSQPVVLVIGIATFIYSFTMPIVSSGVQAIIQSSAPLHMQGRMSATLAALTFTTMILAYPFAGPIADYVFEPLLVEGGPLAGSVGLIIGVGAGRGTGLLFIILGMLIVGLSLVGQMESHKDARTAEALAAGQHE
jgi:MFS family permease